MDSHVYDKVAMLIALDNWDFLNNDQVLADLEETSKTYNTKMKQQKKNSLRELFILKLADCKATS